MTDVTGAAFSPRESVGSHPPCVLSFPTPPSPGAWTFLWFVGFCFLTNQWAATKPEDVLIGADSARAAITFSFFSIFSWVGGPRVWGSRAEGAQGGTGQELTSVP